jgi:cobalt/nickel transport protein
MFFVVRHNEDFMIRALRPGVVWAVLALAASPASAHYNMLLLSSASTRKGETVTLTYQWGHPYEHELFDAPLPESLTVVAPDGKKTDLSKAWEKTTVAGKDGKPVVAYRLRFAPPQRGDYVFTLNTPPIWMAEEEEFYQDTVKAVLHVQAQKGWDHATGQAFEFLPLTRPYGLLPGTVFQAQGMSETKPLAGSLAEIERYNTVAPKELPADEFITRTVKSDPNGVVTCTLPEPGWWCLTTGRSGGKKQHDAKTYPIRQRTTIWVFVDEAMKK